MLEVHVKCRSILGGVYVVEAFLEEGVIGVLGVQGAAEIAKVAVWVTGTETIAHLGMHRKNKWFRGQI